MNELIHAVVPVYPQRAEKEGVRGTVILEALVGKDGRVKKLRYVSGPPPLVKATVKAVRQWRYKPFSLSGKPVKVDTEISVIYTPGKPVQTNPDPKLPYRPPGRFLPSGGCQRGLQQGGSVGKSACCVYRGSA